MQEEFKANKGFTQYVGAFIGIMVVIIIALNVTIPTTVQAINSANLTGTTLTIANILPLLIVVAVLMLVVGLIVMR